MDRGSSYMSQQSDASTIVRRRFSSGSYVTSIAGILKFLIIALFLVCGILFLSTDKCPQTEAWYAILYPTTTVAAAVLSLGLYAVFLFAIAKTNLNFWTLVDITLSLVAAIIIVVVCVITITQCSSNHPIHFIPGPLGLVGAFLLAANAAATYIMRRYQELPIPELRPQSLRHENPRRMTLEA